ncbi:MAG: SET domain-containing protein [Bacteroidota bacterium]
MSLQQREIYVAPSDIEGRGVFAAEDIAVGEIIEICPVVVLSKKDRKVVHETVLHDYYFRWGRKQKKAAIVLGYGSIYNHSFRPNAVYLRNQEAMTLDVICRKAIKAGDEITFNYNGDPKDESPLWF